MLGKLFEQLKMYQRGWSDVDCIEIKMGASEVWDERCARIDTELGHWGLALYVNIVNWSILNQNSKIMKKVHFSFEVPAS